MRLAEAFAVQSRACALLGSPFMQRLMWLLSQHWTTGTRFGGVCADWPGDLGPSSVSMPLRIAGGLHALVLRGMDDQLAAAYPPNDVPDAALLAAVQGAILRHEDFLLGWIESAPQTNEVRRSAVIVPAAHWIAGRHPLPFMCSELGASAGLNLNWDRYAVQAGEVRYGPETPALTLTPDWTGDAPEPAEITVQQRAGVDLNPLDATDPLDVQRLCAYLWPDQTHRMELTRAAIAVQETPVARAEGVQWLGPRLAAQPEGVVHLIYHTIAWQYFPADRRWMINFRVANLDAMAAQLRRAGVVVDIAEDSDSEIGRFARLTDPEGNPIELWQPADR